MLSERPDPALHMNFSSNFGKRYKERSLSKHSKGGKSPENGGYGIVKPR